MKYEFLTGKVLAKGFLGSLLSFLSEKPKVLENKKQKVIKKNEELLVSLGHDRVFGKYVSKKIFYSFKNSSYYRLLNEHSTLLLLNRLLARKNVLVPKVYSLKKGNNSLELRTQYIHGKKLTNVNNSIKIKSVTACIKELRKASGNNDSNLRDEIPSRSKIVILLTLPFYFLTSIFKEPINFKINAFLLVTFLKYLPSFLKRSDLVLTHKDLDPENILISKNKLVILDTEICILAEEETEIAMVARYYSNYLDENELMSLISQFIKNDIQKGKFIALTIYYSIQMLAIEKRNTHFYNVANNYNKLLVNTLLQNIEKSKITFGEKTHKIVNFISKILNTALKQMPKSSFIICYHSVENDGWRFSTPVGEFKKQMDFLKANYEIVSLDEIVKKPGIGKVAVTFDDGYYNNYKNVAPYLIKNGITATFFVLGNPQKANRGELANNKKLMSIENVRELKKNGFEIGYHTSNHGNLLQMSSEELKKDLIDEKKVLEKSLKSKIKYFAYPRGLYGKAIEKVLKRAGFKNAFTIESGRVNLANSYLIPRYSIEGELSFEDFKGSVSTVGLTLGNYYMRALRLKDDISRIFYGLKIANFKVNTLAK